MSTGAPFRRPSADRLNAYINWYTFRRSTKELRDFLRSVRPRSLIVLASALQEEDRPPGKEPKRTTPASDVRTASVDAKMLKEQLIALANAPDNGEVSRKFDQTVTHRTIVDYVMTEYRPLDFYTAYNLACYCARTRQWPKVEQYLYAAVELGGVGVAKQARRDPALKIYLDAKEVRAKLDKLVEGLKDDPEPAAAGAAPPKDPGAEAS